MLSHQNSFSQWAPQYQNRFWTDFEVTELVAPQDVHSGRSTFPSFWIFESLVPVLIAIADVLVFVHGLRAWWANIWDKNKESQDGNKEFENSFRIQNRKKIIAILFSSKRSFKTTGTVGKVLFLESQLFWSLLLPISWHMGIFRIEFL